MPDQALASQDSQVMLPEQSAAEPREDGLFMAALAYLLAPAAVVLAFLAPWRAFAPVIGVALGLALAWGRERTGRPIVPPLAWPYLVLAAGAVWLSGALPPFAENLDWHKHYALLNILVDEPWPPQATTSLGMGTLRYSLAFYVAPAVAAKLLGAWVLPYAVFAWETLGLYLVLLLAFGHERGARAACVLGAVFLLFSGADVLGTAWTGVKYGPAMHIEWWAGFGELSSAVTNLFWAPQHALPGWLLACLVLRHPRRTMRNAGVLLGATAMWSPFVAAGLVPLLLWSAIGQGPRHFLTRSNFVAAPVLLAAAALYLGRGSGGIPADVIWHAPAFTPARWVAFVLLEFGLVALLLARIAPQRRGLLGAIALGLTLLTLFQAGAANDLQMRGSIPLLGALAVLAACAVLEAPRSRAKIALLVCLLAGVATPLGEIARGWIAPRLAEPRAITLTGILKGQEILSSQYLVYGKEETVSVRDLSGLAFSPFGEAHFDQAARRVESAACTDAALVSAPFALPPGSYRIDAVLDWDVEPAKAGTNGGHLSLHGDRMLIPLMQGRAEGRRVTAYLVSGGKPIALSFGLGGWSTGKGFVRLKHLSASAIRLPR